jgi:hypothetical protein
LVVVVQAYRRGLRYTSGNDTAGFRKAVLGLQSIFKFEDELLESLVTLDFKGAIWHPITTIKMIANSSGLVLRAFWKTLFSFGAQIATMLLALSLGFVNYAFSGALFVASLFYMIQSGSLFFF